MTTPHTPAGKVWDPYTGIDLKAEVARLTDENKQLRAKLELSEDAYTSAVTDLNEQVDYTGQQIDLLDAERAKVQAVRDVCKRAGGPTDVIMIGRVLRAIGDGDEQ